MKAMYLDKFGKLQVVTLKAEEGKYTLVENENGTSFYAVTRGLRLFDYNKLMGEWKKYLKHRGVKYTDLWYTEYNGFFAFAPDQPERKYFSATRYNRNNDNFMIRLSEADIYNESITNNFFSK
jgi:hypothetical protein